MSIRHEIGTTSLVCDKCGSRYISSAMETRQVRKRAYESGWRRIGTRDLCSTCRDVVEKEQASEIAVLRTELARLQSRYDRAVAVLRHIDQYGYEDADRPALAAVLREADTL